MEEHKDYETKESVFYSRQVQEEGTIDRQWMEWSSIHLEVSMIQTMKK